LHHVSISEDEVVIDHVRFDSHLRACNGPQIVERDEEMSEVIEHAEQQHEVELAAKLTDVELVNRHVQIPDPTSQKTLGECETMEIFRHDIDRHHVGATPLALKCEKSVVGPDVEHAQAGHVCRQLKRLPEKLLILHRAGSRSH